MGKFVIFLNKKFSDLWNSYRQKFKEDNKGLYCSLQLIL